MFLPIFKGMSGVWLCTSFQISQQIVLWRINNVYCHIWAPVWAKGLLFFPPDTCICEWTSQFLVKCIPSTNHGHINTDILELLLLQLSDDLSINHVTTIIFLLHFFNVWSPGYIWPIFTVVEFIILRMPFKVYQPHLQAREFIFIFIYYF